jgi:phosphatidate cytidylyltransferase
VLAARLGTAIVLIGALLAALFLLPAQALTLLFAAIAALGAHEWARLCDLPRPAALGYAALAAAGVLLPAFTGTAYPVIAIGAVFWVAVAPFWLWRGVAVLHRKALIVAGLAVLVPAGLAMTVMSPSQLLLALGLIWVADTAAYFSGRKFGRHKLAPSISPGKTREGAYGALVGALLYAVACQALNPQLQATVSATLWLPYLIAAAALCVLSIMGDLFESALKRQAGAKDSGRLLPGHGGVLDRIDSATSTLPFAAGLWALIGGK